MSLQAKASRRQHCRREQVLSERGSEQEERVIDQRYELPGRFPPIAVKLNGETASTNPSRGRYSTRLSFSMNQTRAHHDHVRRKKKEEYALPRTPRVPRRLLRVKLFNILHPKAEKVCQL